MIRLCEINYYEPPHWILELGGYKGRRVLQFGRYDNEPTELSKLIGVEARTLKSEAFIATLKNNIINYGLYKKATYLCPECLKESAYARKFWDSKMTQTCPIHRCGLMNLCPSCGEVIKWSRPNVAKCICGFDFRRSTKRKVTDIEVNFSLYLYGLSWQKELLNDVKAIYQEDNPIFCLEFNEFSRMSNLMYYYIKSYWQPNFTNSSKASIKRFYQKLDWQSSPELVFGFFKDWKNNLKQLLTEYEKHLQGRKTYYTIISEMVDLLVELSVYFPIQNSISIYIEKYLIYLLSRHNVKQITILSRGQNGFRSKTLSLAEMEQWLIELNEAWDTPKINLAKLIYMSFQVEYTTSSGSNSGISMILRNLYSRSMWFKPLPPYYTIVKYKE